MLVSPDDVATFREDGVVCLRGVFDTSVLEEVSEAIEKLFYKDHVFVKEPGAEARTPWHQDLPYWPLEGAKLCTVWVPFDRVDPESGAVHYVRGSHRWGRRFVPEHFSDGQGENYEAQGLEAVPDVDAHPEDFDLVSFDVEPGDCVVHHFLTLHGAPGNVSARHRRADALRYVDRDTVYVGARAPGETDPYPDLSPGMSIGGPNFPVVWPQAS